MCWGKLKKEKLFTGIHQHLKNEKNEVKFGKINWKDFSKNLAVNMNDNKQLDLIYQSKL